MSGKFFRRWVGNIGDNLDTLSRFYRGQSVAFKKTGRGVQFLVFSGEREGTEEPNLPSGTLAIILAGYATDRKAVAPIVAVLGIDVPCTRIQIRIEVVSVRG